MGILIRLTPAGVRMLPGLDVGSEMSGEEKTDGFETAQS